MVSPSQSPNPDKNPQEPIVTAKSEENRLSPHAANISSAENSPVMPPATVDSAREPVEVKLDVEMGSYCFPRSKDRFGVKLCNRGEGLTVEFSYSPPGPIKHWVFWSEDSPASFTVRLWEGTHEHFCRTTVISAHNQHSFGKLFDGNKNYWSHEKILAAAILEIKTACFEINEIQTRRGLYNHKEVDTLFERKLVEEAAKLLRLYRLPEFYNFSS